jgi:hypothetical protein
MYGVNLQVFQFTPAALHASDTHPVVEVLKRNNERAEGYYSEVRVPSRDIIMLYVLLVFCENERCHVH